MFPKIFLALVGLASGLTVSGGVFTVFTAIGIVPRFADKTNSAKYIMRYEDMIILGTFCGMLVSVYYDFFLSLRLSFGQDKVLSSLVLAIYGLFTGSYIGCLALSIAEIFNAIPIMARRIRLKRGLGLIILSFAIGKLLGGLLFHFSFIPNS